jgi:hypothetical protein
VSSTGPGRRWTRLAHAGQKGGEKTGPNPVDRGRPGSKRHLLVDGNGTPLVAVLTGAQVYDSKSLAKRLISRRSIRGRYL